MIGEWHQNAKYYRLKCIVRKWPLDTIFRWHFAYAKSEWYKWPFLLSIDSLSREKIDSLPLSDSHWTLQKQKYRMFASFCSAGPWTKIFFHLLMGYIIVMDIPIFTILPSCAKIQLIEEKIWHFIMLTNEPETKKCDARIWHTKIPFSYHVTWLRNLFTYYLYTHNYFIGI